MHSKYYEQIKRYYQEGYGIPKQYYTDAHIAAFVAKGLLTQAEADEIMNTEE